ncbi:MAG: hypothetical protein NTW73_00765 [Candidatus Parcubacteria bacterium]|nr:hypothetical protein [Candidatus Parcubacteria bacterium]
MPISKSQVNQGSIDYCKTLITSTRQIYDSIGSIYCPILNEKVIFNARGFHHLLYGHDGTPRNVSEKIYKLILFPLAIPTIKNATFINEERDIEMRINRKKNALLKKGKTYALTATVGRKKPVTVRVIILKIGVGKLMFWSIMKN